MNKRTFLFYLIIFFTLSTPLFSQTEKPRPKKSFQDGDLIISAAYSRARPAGKFIDFFDNRNLAPDTYANLQSNNFERRVLGTIQSEQMQGETKINLFTLGVGLDYALNDIVGIGLSVSQLRIQVRDFYPGTIRFFLGEGLLFLTDPDFTGACLSVLTSGCTDTAPGLGDLRTLIKTNFNFSTVETLDFHLGFHFLTGQYLDPYFKIVVGVRPGYKVNALKGGGILGMRYKFAKRFSIFGELHVEDHSINQSGPEYTAAESQINPRGVRFGIGLHL